MAFEQETLIRQITTGNMDGRTIFICHYNRPDLDKKALRNIPPTKVIVASNDKLPKGKRIYYSKSHFKALNKSGKPIGRPIPIFDNTGFRSYTGTPLEVFFSEVDCAARWNQMLDDVKDRLNERLISAEDLIKQDIAKIESMKA